MGSTEFESVASECSSAAMQCASTVTLPLFSAVETLAGASHRLQLLKSSIVEMSRKKRCFSAAAGRDLTKQPPARSNSDLVAVPRRYEARACCSLGAAAILVMFVSLGSAAAGLNRYSSFIVADSPNQFANSIRVTYLGTNGYQLEASGHALLVDPYFSRISLARAALAWPIRPDAGRIDEGLAHLRGNPDAILATHAHFDHLLDVPVLMRRTDARLIGSATAVDL